MAILLKHAKNVTIADDATAVAAGQVVPTDWNASHNLTGTANTVVAFDGSGVATELTTTGSGNVVLATSPTLVTPVLGTPASGNLANCTFPTLNQNTTGTAAGLSATLAVSSGGTGATTLTGVLKGNGTSAFTAATAGTDYLDPAAVGVSIQAYDADLSAIAALSGTSGLLKKTAADTWTLDTTSYLSGNVSLTSGVTGTLPVANGGTGITSFGTGVATALGSAVNASGGVITYSTYAPASGKTLTVSNSITLAGTDSTTMTFPGASSSIGYLNVPQVGGAAKTSSYTAVLADSGQMIVMNGATLTATIPSNSSVAYAVGTVLTFVNIYAGNLSIAITTDTMTLVNTASTTGTRTLAQNGIATAVKVSSTSWIISGSGLT